jgi:hypothetical protein
MGDKPEYAWFRDLPWLIVCVLLSSAYCLFTATHIGATNDETSYLLVGLKGWHLRSSGELTQMGAMPLPMDVATLPLYVWELLRGQRFDLLMDIDRMLPVARAATLLFWWAVLFYGWRIGRDVAGPWGGRLALVLLACEPTLLAHAGLVTADVAITACMFALVYHFREGRTSGWMLRVGLPSVLYALALLAKASALVFGPLCLLVVELDRLWRAQAFTSTATAGLRQWLGRVIAELRPFRRDFIQIFALGFLLMLVYCGSDWLPKLGLLDWAYGMPDGPKASVARYVADHLCIFGNGALGLFFQIRHNCDGHGVFIAGRTDPHSLWYYFPVAMTIKLTASLLALPLIVAAIRPRALLNWVTALTGVLILFSVTFRVQIGIRLILPLVGFFIVGVAGAAANMITTMGPGWWKRLTAGAVVGCVLWTAAASVLVWPNALCYVNELWGGTADGYKQLSDSNYDWGQGLKELRDWQQRNQIENLDVWYFGTDPNLFKAPFHPILMRNLGLQGPDDVITRFRGRYLAVSTNYIFGSCRITNEKTVSVAVQYLRTLRPFARTTTFLIYDFTTAESSQ